MDRVSKLESTFCDLKYLMELTYKMLKGKEIGVSVDEVEIPTRPIETQEEAPFQEQTIDPTNIASTISVNKDREKIDSVLQNLNITIDPIDEEEPVREEENMRWEVRE